MSTPPVAPRSSWVRELVRTKRAPIPWELAVLTAVAVATPVGIALVYTPEDPALLGIGILASMGALIASLSDRGGAAVERVRRICSTAAFGALGLAVGTLVLGNDVATLVVVVVAALASGIAGVISANASLMALQFLVYVIVGSAIDFGLRPPWWGPVVLLVGAAWRLGLTALAIAARGAGSRSPERQAVAGVYTAIAGQLDAAGTDAVDSARRDVTTALNEAYDLMVAARTTLAGRDPRWRGILTLLNAATPIVEAATTITVEGARVPAAVPNALRSIARTIEDRRAGPPKLPPPDRSTPGRSALTSALRPVAALMNGEDPSTTTVAIQRPDAGRSRPRARERLRGIADRLTTGGGTWSAVLRLVLCIAVAEAVSALFPLQRPYWITLTVAVVMKPDFGSVFARAVQRGLGTVVGVLIGAAVVVVLPTGWPQVIVLALLAAAMPIAIRRNYGLFATFLTPVIVILLELANKDDTSLIVSRVTDTLIGCAIVLLIGYLPWPATWHVARRLGDRVADVVTDVAGYLTIALGPTSSASRRSTARRATYRRLSDLRTLVQQTLAEPPPMSTTAASWWPQIVALERIADAITSTMIRQRQAGDASTVVQGAADQEATAPHATDGHAAAPHATDGHAAAPHAMARAAADSSAVELLHDAVADLAVAIRTGAPPTQLDLPDEEPLSAVSDEIAAARALLTT